MIQIKYIHKDGVSVEPITIRQAKLYPPVTDGVILNGQWRKVSHTYYDTTTGEMLVYYE